ncbi:MAG: hypothetical protein ACXW3Z_00410 [Limisphaerales bacterium]
MISELSYGESPPAKPEHGSEADYDHGGAPRFLPHWMRARWPVLTVAIAGLALAGRILR